MSEGADAASQPDIALWLGVEALGAGLSAFIIIAAGILGERYAGGNVALAMLITCVAGAAAFAGLARAASGVAVAVFNPALALVQVLAGRLALLPALLAASAQIAGVFLGVMIAHLVTNVGLVQVAGQIQRGAGVWTGEFLASALFAFVMLAGTAREPGRAAFAGAACLLAASLATPSLSFANPAITLARALTDSFTAIRLEDAAIIAVIQCAGAVTAYVVMRMTLHGHHDRGAHHGGA